jgi:hypoxanthine phosphoribosyltransferase
MKTSTALAQTALFPIQFPGESIVYTAPTWAELYDLASSVAMKIKLTDQSFDKVITLASGGWPMAVVMSDLLDIDQPASIGVKLYTGVNQRLHQPEIYHPLPINVKGKRILLFDDVADTGESLAFVKAHLEAAGAKLVRTATLLFKPHSKLRPDYFGAETDSWVVFPHDLVESIEVIGQRWRLAGVPMTEIAERLAKFGFKSSWVEQYLKQKTS